MNTTTARTTPSISLRARVQLQCAYYDAISQFPNQQDTIALMQAQAMKDIQARANPASVPKHIAQRATVTQLHSTAQRYAMDKKAALQQAKNNLATANHIRKSNAKLGGALQSLAMGDMNSLRAKNSTAKQCSVVAEYSNLGRFWE